MVIKWMCKQCVPDALSSPSSAPGNEAKPSLAWFVRVKHHFLSKRKKWTSVGLEHATFSVTQHLGGGSVLRAELVAMLARWLLGSEGRTSVY